MCICIVCLPHMCKVTWKPEKNIEHRVTSSCELPNMAARNKLRPSVKYQVLWTTESFPYPCLPVNAVIKYPKKKNRVVKKGFVWFIIPGYGPLLLERQGKAEWKQKHGPLLARSQLPFSLSILLRTPYLGTIATHNGLSLCNSHQLTIRMTSTDMPRGQSDLDNSSLSLPSQMSLSYIKLLLKTNQHLLP